MAAKVAIKNSNIAKNLVEILGMLMKLEKITQKHNIKYSMYPRTFHVRLVFL